MKKIIAVTFFAFGIQACSNSTPSASDVQKALESNIAICPNLSIENVKVMNGLKIDDLTHQVKFTYDLKVNPLPSSKIEEINKLRQTRDELSKQRNDVAEQLKELYDQLSKEVSHSYSNEQWPASEWQARYDQLKATSGAKDLEAKKESLGTQLSALYKQAYSGSSTVLLDAWGNSNCRKISGVTSEDAVIQGGVTSFENTIVMQKTDNGWMAAN